ncbi:MAG TPA: division/cell wall cluster transcriptional repressor MraZ [Bacilli bacterium]|jgi:MraZ protein|nr:MAG: cell division protein MraZ [Tenericutes bacterium ADurb.Bin024]TAH59232.1 MAG: division/cell wall cluster transcriptional repressor MraZ [Bacillota bacterium]HOE54145.1 division/cell wall cluster transcriptional repressor MraZ [Bacilli bacterium]HOH95095.1 division/cell wall cluster transcriptional repressor MraZ [Bacilli bacterium]HOQ70977.1 division/cell wall cluster transcriptional repressor MraZ [Bacilli bacterium]
MYNVVKESGRKWEMKFFGTYYHSLDAKGRLVVPARFRETLKDLKTLYILQGFDGAISVYPEEAYHQELSFLEAQNFKNADARAYIRTIYASIEELEVDAAGRITLPVRIQKKYDIGQKVIVIGVGDHLEIWDEERYLSYERDACGNLEDLAAKLQEKA